MTNSNSTDRNTARKITNFLNSGAPHGLGDGIPGWDCVDSPLHGNRDGEQLDAPGRLDCYFVKTEMDGSPVRSTLFDLECSLAGMRTAAIDTKVLKVTVLPKDQQTDKCWRTFKLLTLKDAITELKRTGRRSIFGRIGIWPNGSAKARNYVDNTIMQQSDPLAYAEMLGNVARDTGRPASDFDSAACLRDAKTEDRAAENKPIVEEVVAEILGDLDRAKAVPAAAFPKPTSPNYNEANAARDEKLQRNMRAQQEARDAATIRLSIYRDKLALAASEAARTKTHGA